MRAVLVAGAAVLVLAGSSRAQDKRLKNEDPIKIIKRCRVLSRPGGNLAVQRVQYGGQLDQLRRDRLAVPPGLAQMPRHR